VVAAGREYRSVPEFRVASQSPFDWPFVGVESNLVCDRCHHISGISYPALADWRDLEAVRDQRRAADGHPCQRCGQLRPPPSPLLQYRRGDAIGLLIGFPPDSDPGDDRQFIQDTLAAAYELGLDGANVVVSARMAWWGALYNRPLGPDLIAGLDTPLPESAEETARWKAATVAALDLPDVNAALNAFASSDDYSEALDIVRRTPELVDPNWRVTVRHLGRALEHHQQDPDAAQLLLHRLGRLSQIQLVGIDGADDDELSGELAGLVDAAIKAVEPEERRKALIRAVEALDHAPPSMVTAAAHISLVASLLADPQREPARHQELIDAARRARAVAHLVAGDDHELTRQATLNLAVAIEEDPHADDPASALASSRSLLEGIAPTAARTGSILVADIATNLATIVARQESRADHPELTRAWLDHAAHLRAILQVDAGRSDLVALVDTASTLRSRIIGDPGENAHRSVELLREAQEIDKQSQLLSPAETTLLAGNLANALHSLHTYRQTPTSDADRIAASHEAIRATKLVHRLHPVAIEAINNAGSILSDAYSDGLRAGNPDPDLWDAARTHLEDARQRATEAFPDHHLTALRISVNLGTVYGRLHGDSIADPERARELFNYVIDNTPPGREQFRLVASTNLAQLAMGQGAWQQAADAYAIADEATRKLIGGARTRITKLGEILQTADIAVRRALALTTLGDLDGAISVLVANRAKLAPHDLSEQPQHDGRAAAIHVAACDYGSFAIITGPDNHRTGLRSLLASSEVKAALASVLNGANAVDREVAHDALAELLRTGLIDPINELLDEMPPFDHLQLMTAGSLTSCPLATVPDSEGRTWQDRWKADRFVSSWPGEDQPLPPDPATVAVINPDGSLPFADAEHETISTFSNDTSMPPPGWAIRDWLMDSLPRATVAHLACHATLDPADPNGSAFHLGDTGDITVNDLAPLDLTNLRLLVAPACQSAAANPTAPDELLGVAHALLHAGATGVIASLWDADDDATALVIARLYLELNAGQPPGQALASAQRFVRDATAGNLIEVANKRLADHPSATWLPYRLAVEFAARSAHPRLGQPDQHWFAHPARWAALSYVRT